MARSGISYSAYAEWRLAARWAGYTFEAFCRLEGEEQSAVVATYRLQNQVDGVIAREQARALRRANKK